MPTAATLFVAFAIISSTAAAACDIADLGFLEGVWRSEQGNHHGEERWIRAAANTWAGAAWEGNDSVVSFAEAMSIVPHDGTVELHLRHFDGALNHAWEEKDQPMIFRLARCDASSVVFDGTGEKTGEHITYRRLGDRLEFTGDFLRKGAPFQVVLQMQKSGA